MQWLNFKISIEKPTFTDHFQKVSNVIRTMGYNIDSMQQSAYLFANLFTVMVSSLFARKCVRPQTQ